MQLQHARRPRPWTRLPTRPRTRRDGTIVRTPRWHYRAHFIRATYEIDFLIRRAYEVDVNRPLATSNLGSQGLRGARFGLKDCLSYVGRMKSTCRQSPRDLERRVLRGAYGARRDAPRGRSPIAARGRSPARCPAPARATAAPYRSPRAECSSIEVSRPRTTECHSDAAWTVRSRGVRIQCRQNQFAPARQPCRKQQPHGQDDQASAVLNRGENARKGHYGKRCQT